MQELGLLLRDEGRGFAGGETDRGERAQGLTLDRARKKLASLRRSVNTPRSFSATPGAPATGTHSEFAGSMKIGCG